MPTSRGPIPLRTRGLSQDSLSRASLSSSSTRNLSIPGRHPPPLTPRPTVAASARPPHIPPQAAPPPPGAAGQGPLRFLATAPAVGRAAARPRRAGTVRAEAAPPPPGGRSGAGAGRLAGPTSAQPGRGRPQNRGRARRGRGRACDRARSSHLDAEARASLSPSAMATPPSRSPHSVFTAPDRPPKSGQTAARPLAAAALASAGPDRASGSDWLARRLFSTSAPDWLSRTPFPGEPLTFHSSSASHPQTRFPPRPGPDGQWGNGERLMGGRLGGVVGGSAANGSAPHIPAQQRRPRPPSSPRVAPRATPDYPGTGARPARKVQGRQRAREPAQPPLRRAWVLPPWTVALPRWVWLPTAIAGYEDPARELPAWLLRMRSHRCVDLQKGP